MLIYALNLHCYAFGVIMTDHRLDTYIQLMYNVCVLISEMSCDSADQKRLTRHAWSQVAKYLH